jgi:cob(I)alamin adenosyltransferase
MNGLIHLYTGDGKGKTCSAIGLLIRALGHNKKVVYISFGKNFGKNNFYGETKILKKLNVPVLSFAKEYPCFVKKVNRTKLKLECEEGIKKILSLYNKKVDIIVADEILVCVRDKFLNLSLVEKIISLKPKNLELILTGRCNQKILDRLKDKVDYISIIKKVKHPYEKGVRARKGIEF